MKQVFKLVEREITEGPYGFKCNEIIIDSKKHGRVLLMDDFGGMDTLDGGSVLWEHGMVIQLKNNDTLESLYADMLDDEPMLILAFRLSDDKARPVLNWSSSKIEKIVDKLEAKGE